MSATKKIFVVGGTGAQGIPVIRGLVSDGQYAVRILTRDATSRRAKELAALNPANVELVQGSFTSESDLRAGYAGCYGAFINIDGFATGEKTEMFWAIRAYELALKAGIRFFVYGNLDYGLKKGGYDAKFRAGHYDGKGRIGEWILWQNQSNRALGMRAALFTTGPYMEMAIASSTPMAPTIEESENGEKVVTWRVPLTENGAVPHVSLEDCGAYVRWLFDHPDRADGLDLEVAIEHVHYADMALAFEKVTGHRARFVDVDLETYWRDSAFGAYRDNPAGYMASLDDPATLSMKANFTGFWNLFRASGHNHGVIRRNYALLDEIYPGRIRSVEEFFRREDERAKQAGSSLWEKVIELKPILKNHEDFGGTKPTVDSRA